MESGQTSALLGISMLGPHRNSDKKAHWNFPGSRGAAPVQGLQRFTLAEMDRLVLPVPGEGPRPPVTEAGTRRRPPQRVAGSPSAFAGAEPTSNHAPLTRERPVRPRPHTSRRLGEPVCSHVTLQGAPPLHTPSTGPAPHRTSPSGSRRGSFGTSAYRTPLLLAAPPSARSTLSGLALRTPRPLTRSATNRHAH